MTGRIIRGRYGAVVLVLLLLLAPVFACGRSTQEDAATVTLTPLDAQAAQGIEDAAGTWADTLPTAGGSVAFLETGSEIRGDKATTLVSRDPDDGAFQWAVTLGPQWVSGTSLTYGTAQEPTARPLGVLSSGTGYGVVSPDGLYLSVVLRPTPAEPGEEGGGGRTPVVVLDAASGRLVRTVEVSGLVLGQVLTHEALVVLTAQGYFPAAGGMLTVVPLDGASEEPTEIPTDQWLVGAGVDSVLLSPHGGGALCAASQCGPTTLTRLATDGTELGTMTGVNQVFPGGWVERYTDPAAAVDLVVAKGTMSEEAFTSAWEALGREVVDVDTGSAVDVTGKRVSATELPTGHGLLVEEADPADAVTYTPVMWLSAADDGHPHTEGLEAFAREN